MAEQTQLHSTWHRYVQGLEQSPQKFYGMVQDAVTKRQVEGVKYTTVEHKEGGFFSSKRLYLRVQRGDLYYLICGAPFADGFFVSARLISEGKFLDAVLFKDGSVAKGLFKPDTYFSADTTLMYQSIVHDALMSVVDSLIEGSDLPPIPEADRRPVLADFYH